MKLLIDYMQSIRTDEEENESSLPQYVKYLKEYLSKNYIITRNKRSNECKIRSENQTITWPGYKKINELIHRIRLSSVWKVFSIWWTGSTTLE